MTTALTLVAIAITVIVVSRLCESISLPAPIALLGVGLVASVLPFIPNVVLDPDVVLLGLLPPLLYAAALGTSLIDFRANRMPILGLSVAMVLVTAFAVGLVASWLLPIPFAVAVALGAIVAPPDAVAATAVARRIGLPRRITTILEGESLLNDATALVSMRTAVAAAGLTANAHGFASHGPVSVGSVSRDFALAVIGGIGVGWLAFVVIAFVRRTLTTPSMDTALSFVAPFLSFIPAELLGASGVLAVVTTGVLLAHKSAVLQSAASRLSEQVNWSSVTFLLENAVFLLIGLQLSTVLADVQASDIPLGQAMWAGVVVLLVVLLIRPIMVFGLSFIRQAGMPSDAAGLAVTSWAGMRGVVTLAAALTLPFDTPARPTLVLIALIVTIGTLVLQSSTLPALARALGVRGPDPREDALQEATVLQATTSAGVRALEAAVAQGKSGNDDVIADELRSQAEMRTHRVWERLGASGPDQDETPSETRRRLRLAMLAAEREELSRIRDEDTIDHAILSGVIRQMDAEETALGRSEERARALREAELRAPDQVAVGCAHLNSEPICTAPSSMDGCPDCLREGLTWVHLRLCTHCGNVGCCDSSPGRHASKHFAATSHPVVRSLEPGESWRWCFVDEVLG